MAEYDPLKDGGEAYAQRLEEARVPMILWCYAGHMHGFIWEPTFADSAHALDLIRSFMAGE